MIIPELVKCVTTFTRELPALSNEISQNKIVQKIIPKDILNTLKNLNWTAYTGKISKFLFTGVGGAVNAVASVASSVVSVVFTIVMGIIFADKKSFKCYFQRKDNRKTIRLSSYHG